MLKPKKPDVTHFYHYSSTKNLHFLKPILLQNMLYIPSPSELNDPAEARPKFSVPTDEGKFVQYMYSSLISAYPNLSAEEREHAKQDIASECHKYGMEHARNMIVDFAYEGINRNNGIYSMSKRYDNLALWAHYGDNHSGYCLEFKNDGFFANAYEVTYTDDEKAFDFAELEEISGDFLWTKTKSWESEEEVRIVTPSLIKPPIFFNSELLTRLIFGYQISSSDKSKILDWAEQRSTPLSVVQIYYDRFEDKIELRDLN